MVFEENIICFGHMMHMKHMMFKSLIFGRTW